MIVSVDKIDFLRPVEIGDIVEFESLVCFTGNTSINVEVSVKKLHSRISSDKKLTNNCHFTFVAVDEKGKPQNVPKVVPASLEELTKFALGYRMYGWK